jgi:hypothetical protein
MADPTTSIGDITIRQSDNGTTYSAKSGVVTGSATISESRVQLNAEVSTVGKFAKVSVERINEEDFDSLGVGAEFGKKFGIPGVGKAKVSVASKVVISTDLKDPNKIVHETTAGIGLKAAGAAQVPGSDKSVGGGFEVPILAGTISLRQTFYS